MKIGEYFIKNQIITENQLSDALEYQKDKRNLLIGEIFVERKIIKISDLLKYLLRYMEQTGHKSESVKEWVSQEEIDSALSEYNS